MTLLEFLNSDNDVELSRSSIEELFPEVPNALFWLVASWHNHELVPLLIKAGYSIYEKDKDGLSAVHYCVLNTSKSTSSSALEMAEALHRAGADFSAADHSGKSPLHYACKLGNFTLVEFLLTLGVPVDIRDSEFGQVPLHFAARYGHLEVSSLLIQVRVDLDISDNLGWTPLHHAVSGNHLSVARCLIEGGASLCVQSESGLTPLHLSTTRGNIDVTKLLLKHCKDLTSIEDTQGQTCLHYSCKFGFQEIGEMLLEEGVDCTVQDDKGWTPLHFAANGGYSKLCYLLLQSGSYPNKLTKFGMTPLHLCVDNYLKIKKEQQEEKKWR
ncbi:hypothetical protein GEMRC1_005998 [Eukaryota sp. GEM-RC1]